MDTGTLHHISNSQQTQSESGWRKRHSGQQLAGFPFRILFPATSGYFVLLVRFVVTVESFGK